MDNSKLVSDLSEILEGLDSSQEQLEKDAFDVINSSDTSLNLVKESISSVEEILKMITELNEIAEESAAMRAVWTARDIPKTPGHRGRNILCVCLS